MFCVVDILFEMMPDFGVYFCFVLFCRQEVVCAGIFRVFGQEVAELPLVATHKDWEGQVI